MMESIRTDVVVSMFLYNSVHFLITTSKFVDILEEFRRGDDYFS